MCWGAKVAEFLMAGGHERIAHIAGWQGSSTGRDRQEGFVSALEAAGAEPFDVLEGMYKRDIAMAAARSLVDRPDPADAIFVGNDHMAFAVMDAVRDAGMTPGRDISIVGYDDVPMASWGSYDLTTLRQPVNRMVDATVETLIDQIEKPAGKPGLFEIEGELIVRSSARIPEGWTQ